MPKFIITIHTPNNGTFKSLPYEKFVNEDDRADTLTSDVIIKDIRGRILAGNSLKLLVAMADPSVRDAVVLVPHEVLRQSVFVVEPHSPIEVNFVEPTDIGRYDIPQQSFKIPCGKAKE